MHRQGKKYLQLLGKNILEKRREKGISQQELADNADIAKSTVQRIESGEMNPTILMLWNISLGLETDLAELIKVSHN
ncbi:MAG TPA: helix-turn-helix transcriptional regulator [Cyclobacteriaceae bacterium]|nr:helix-turn-helix transcriptional regulator [Cyclobacteriaceae bacterium]